ncbi:NUDIX hydrolase domain-like protein [Nemania sp. FL0031]|nr:NUDIX hydrolase domain-like protein [Nemania sp. FL0031]
MASATKPNPRFGTCVVIRNREGKLLVQERAGSHGAGTMAFPGGHVDFGEEIETCAVRETLEETGLKVKDAKMIVATNDVFWEVMKHYATFFVEANMEDPDAEPQIMEPKKCNYMGWASWSEILEWVKHDDDPEWKGKKAFLPIVNLVKKYPNLDLSKKCVYMGEVAQVLETSRPV